MHLVSALLLLALPFLVYAGRKEVKLVIWDDIVGRLNWLRPEIVRLAHDKCNTKFYLPFPPLFLSFVP